MTTMKNKRYFLFVFGVLLLLFGKMQSKPIGPGEVGAGLFLACLEMEEDDECDKDTGPVCGIDASGFQRTFQNRCFAELAYCREGRYYAVVVQGEC